MKKHDWYLKYSEEIAHALSGYYWPSVQKLLAEKELTGTDLFVVQVALSEAPRPLTADVIWQRTPYVSPETIYTQFTEAVEKGLLTTVSDGAYALTDEGRQLAQRVPVLVSGVAQTWEPLPRQTCERAAILLRQLVEDSLAAAEPAAKAALHRSRFYDPGLSAPVLERIRRYLNDLAAFRDDVHLAAWRAYDLAGPEWEAFSHVQGDHVFGEPVVTAAELAQKLGGFRGYDEAAYEEALQKTAALGWLGRTEDGRYQPTAKGNQVRQIVEDETDRLFYTPWTLSEAERDELKELMEKLAKALQPPEQQTIWETAVDTRVLIGSRYSPLLKAAMKEANLPAYGLFLLMQAQVVEPEALTVDHILEIVPYMSGVTVQERLEELVAGGFLTVETPGQAYNLTEVGGQIIWDLLAVVEQEVGQWHTLAPEQVIQVAEWLERLSQVSAEAEEPAAKPVTSHARYYALDASKTPLLRVARAVSEIAAFRDDAHMAAWGAYNVPGYQWEAFSHVWGDNIWGDAITTSAEAAEKFSFRGYSEADYEAGLQTCAARGWLAVTDGGAYEVTERGRQLRQEAEERTDALFYAPWDILTVPERFELYDLLTQLKQVLPSESDNSE